MLSPNLASVSSKGTLSIVGTSASDVVNIGVKGSKIKLDVNGAGQTFSKTSVKRLSISLLSGNDKLTLGAGLRTATVFGGPGKDSFSLRNGVADVLDAGSGVDKAQVDPSDVLTSVETLLV